MLHVLTNINNFQNYSENSFEKKEESNSSLSYLGKLILYSNRNVLKQNSSSEEEKTLD
jgi:hypothetical protein